ncbi:ABC transporter permease [Gordonia shandongensis]|uniref:ABC transporter permease n=1 Tax=Gordonia shandongensis TaxID=376351 RepID=UPI00047EA7DF|nr:ABC transporter permease [Gordonia shandongensis]
MTTRPVRRVRRAVRALDDAVVGIGRMSRFVVDAVIAAVRAARHYGSEMLRLVADMSLGSGALALIGGTVMITGFLTLFAGATVAVQGYSTLGNIGVDAMTGFLSAYVNIRVVVPVTAGIGLAATLGASTTAELGAMRISEEIDALEVMAVRAMPYLVGTRLLAGMITILPIYAVALIFSFLSSRVVTVNVLGQSPGVYEHYFSTFLIPSDVLWSFLQAIVMAILVMLVCTYYGYYASGGPEDVGVATGRSVRLSLIAVVTVTLIIALVLYGSARELRLAG